MVEAAPAPPFEVVQPELVFEFLVVALDPPAQLGQADELGAGQRRRQRGQPVLRGGRFPVWPLDQQPLFRSWRRAPLVAVRGSHADGGEPRAHRASGALTPAHRPPSARGQLLGQDQYAERPMPGGATNQRRRAPAPLVRLGHCGGGFTVRYLGQFSVSLLFRDARTGLPAGVDGVPSRSRRSDRGSCP